MLGHARGSHDTKLLAGASSESVAGWLICPAEAH